MLAIQWLVTFIALPLLWILINVLRRLLRVNGRSARRRNRRSDIAKRIWIVLGSGGHTTELLGLCKNLDWKHNYVTVVISDTDRNSENALKRALRESEAGVDIDDLTIVRIPRAREVGGSVRGAVFKSIQVGARLFLQMLPDLPELVLANGPGVCVPVVIAALAAECMIGRATRIIFVESYCRVSSLSMTGKLLLPYVDRFCVHWPRLTRLAPHKIEYIGADPSTSTAEAQGVENDQGSCWAGGASPAVFT